MSYTIDSERIPDSTEDSYQYLLNLVRKLEMPRLEIDVDQLIVELNWADTLQTLIDYANKNVLRSFRLDLKMDEASTKSN